jgi:hypothetical protein
MKYIVEPDHITLTVVNKGLTAAEHKELSKLIKAAKQQRNKPRNAKLRASK